MEMNRDIEMNIENENNNNNNIETNNTNVIQRSSFIQRLLNYFDIDRYIL